MPRVKHIRPLWGPSHLPNRERKAAELAVIDNLLAHNMVRSPPRAGRQRAQGRGGEREGGGGRLGMRGRGGCGGGGGAG